MIRVFQLLVGFLNTMDSKAITSLLVSLGLFGFVFVMLVYGRDMLGLTDQSQIQVILARIAESPMAIIGVISVYVLLAMTGFPQTFLIAGTVAVFGPTQGAIYAWVATMSSAIITFMMGHIFGGRFVQSLSGGRAGQLIRMVQARGVFTTMVIRWTPSAPFIVINSICGAAHIRLWKFLTGTSLGIIPKILFIALFAGQVDQLMAFFTSRDPRSLIALGAILVAWIAFLLLVRWIYRRMNTSEV